MKIQKRFIAILCLILMILTFLSCNGTSSSQYIKYNAYISYGGNEGLSTNAVDLSKAKQYVKITDNDIPEPKREQVEVEVFGKVHKGAYTGQKKVFEFDTPSYVYKTDEGDRIIIDKTGKIIRFSYADFFTHYIKNVSSEKAITPEKARDYACDYLVQLLGAKDAARYTGSLPDTTTSMIIVVFQASYDTFEDYYVQDKVLITIDQTGKLLEYELINAGMYKDKKLPDDLDDDKFQEIIAESVGVEKNMIRLEGIKDLRIMSDGRLLCRTKFSILYNGNASERVTAYIPLE